MPKRPLSVTLDEDNLVWLRGQSAASGHRSLSETLDRLITDARTAGRGSEAAIRSVVATIDLDASDPSLDTADAMIRSQFQMSLSRPLLVRERPPSTRRGARKRTRR